MRSAEAMPLARALFDISIDLEPTDVHVTDDTVALLAVADVLKSTLYGISERIFWRNSRVRVLSRSGSICIRRITRPGGGIKKPDNWAGSKVSEWRGFAMSWGSNPKHRKSYLILSYSQAGFCSGKPEPNLAILANWLQSAFALGFAVATRGYSG